MKPKILIIGFGSIGQRHYDNLQKLGYRDILVFDPDDKRFINKKVNRIERFGIKNLEGIDVAFVCNPNNLHVKAAILCARAGCHLFIEKPLSHSMAGIEKLEKICLDKKIVTMVGCNMRFHPCLVYIKKYLDKNSLGKVYTISHEYGYYLPFWRPKQDYRKNYAAKKETGGGVILDETHEFDLLFWQNEFSGVLKSSFVYNHTSELQIRTEDACFASFEFKNKVLGLIRCDYLQKHYSRKCKIVGEKGNLEWDFSENIVWLKNEKGQKELFKVKNFDFNNVYIDEVRYFFNCIKTRQKTFNEISAAKKVLKYCVNKK